MKGWAVYGREGGRTNERRNEVSQSRNSKYIVHEAGANFYSPALKIGFHFCLQNRKK